MGIVVTVIVLSLVDHLLISCLALEKIPRTIKLKVFKFKESISSDRTSHKKLAKVMVAFPHILFIY